MTARKRYPQDVLEQTAAVCAEVHDVQPHAQAVAERFGISVKNARHQISAARYNGLDIPADDPAKWRKCYQHPKLVCGCGFAIPTDRGLVELQRHTISEHGRLPSKVERMPRIPA